MNHDDGLNYHVGCLYSAPSNGFSKPEPGDGGVGGPLGTIGCGFTTTKSLPNASAAVTPSVAIASIDGSIFADNGPKAPFAFATVVFADGGGSCPSLYAETATINSEICTVSTVPSDADECFPNAKISLTWSGRHHYGCGFDPQISFPNQQSGGSTAAPKTIPGLEVHADGAHNLWQQPFKITR
jgi:hypothetical protein